MWRLVWALAYAAALVGTLAWGWFLLRIIMNPWY
jgi:hypothetical protein